MEIRYATEADKLSIIRSLQNKHMDFNTPTHAKKDIENHSLIICIDNNKIVGSLALCQPTHGYWAIKRGCVYNKKNQGKGIMSALFQYALSLNKGYYGCTPWAENTKIISIITKYGFTYQKTVCEKYLVYTKGEK